MLLFCFPCATQEKKKVLYLKWGCNVLHQLCFSSNSEATEPKRSILLPTNWSFWQLLLIGTEFLLPPLLQIHNSTLLKRQVKLVLTWENSELKCKITALCLLIRPTVQPRSPICSSVLPASQSQLKEDVCMAIAFLLRQAWSTTRVQH